MLRRLPFVIPAKAGIHAQSQGVLKRRASRLPSRNEAVGFRLQASYFLATAPKSNQKAPPPGNCAPLAKEQAREGYPALRARGGVRRQALLGCASCSAGKPGEAILACPSGNARSCRSASMHCRTPGLTSDASASCLARREHTRRLNAVTSLRCSAQLRGTTAQVGSASRVRLLVVQEHEPHNRSSRNRLRFRRWQFAFDFPPPVGGAEHRKAGATGARACWRGARQDAEASSVRPGMACRWTPLRLRSAGYPSSRFCFCDEGRRRRGAAFFGYFLALLPKSNSPVGENPRPQFAKADAARDASAG